MNVLCENIGVDDKGNWKYHCPSCHCIISTKEKKENISCPDCQFIPGETVSSDLTYGELDEEFNPHAWDFAPKVNKLKIAKKCFMGYLAAAGVLFHLLFFYICAEYLGYFR